jgi:hypothetical protein
VLATTAASHVTVCPHRAPKLVAEGDKVAIRVELRGRGRDGVEAARQFGTLFTIRDDRVVEFVGRMEWQDAVEGAHA